MSDDQKKEDNVVNGVDINKLSELDQWLSSCVDKGKFPGTAISVFRKDKLVHSSYSGYMDMKSKEQIHENTLYRCYSMTKPVTAVALMMLFEEGKFKLDDPLYKYIPSYEKMAIYDYEANKDIDYKEVTLDNIKTIPCKQPILVQHVFAHTSGLSYALDPSGAMDPVDGLLGAEFHSNRNGKLSEYIDKQLCKIPLCFEPGTKWNYSFSSDVCGRLVEILSGMQLDEFFYSRIFKPLRMENASFFIEDGKFTKLDKKKLATLYKPSYFGKDPTKVSDDEFENYKLLLNEYDQSQSKPKCVSAGGSQGGLIMTMADYMKFAKMLLNGGTCKETGAKILAKETLELMTKNHLLDGKDMVSSCHERSFLKPALPKGYGFGLGVGVALEDNVWSKGSFYWGGAANTSFWVDWEKEICVVFMTQVIGIDGTKWDWRTAIMKFVYNAIVE